MFHAAVARLRARRPLWAIYPTRRFGVAILAAGALWLIPGAAGRAIAGVAAALLVVAAAFDYARLAPSRRVTVVRDAPASIGLGDVSELSYTLRSDWPWALRVEVFDTLPSGLSTDARLAPVPLAARDTRTVTLPVTGVARGSQVLGDVALRSTTPLGLVARLGRPPMPVTSIAVVPSLRNVRRYRLLAMQHRLSDAGIRALKQRGEGTSVAGLRDYVPGDDPRLLDWKASARHSRLITRELSIERSQTVISLIDCGRAMTQSAGRFSRFEHVLSSSLLLADVAVTSGDRVGLIAFDDRIRAVMAPSRGTGALALVRSTLSGLDASLTEPDYASAFRTLATRQRRRALVVFFTDVIDVRVAKQFAAYAGRAARRHAMIIVAIQNEALLEATRTNASGSLALYRRAAAEELVREREEALARMRQAGVTVLDVAPDRMATAVVNRYLELKAKGSI